MAVLYYLEMHNLLFGKGNSRKLRWRFKELSPARSGNECVVGVNGICVTPCAINWFCLPLMCLRPAIKWFWRTGCCSAFNASEAYRPDAIAAGAACEELSCESVRSLESACVNWEDNCDGISESTNRGSTGVRGVFPSSTSTCRTLSCTTVSTSEGVPTSSGT